MLFTLLPKLTQFEIYSHFDWENSKNFYYVAKVGTVLGAAKFLNMTVPTLSRQITSLENHLNCKLFSRSVKGMKLTRKGEEFFAVVEQTFLSFKSFSYNMRNNGQKRKIRIAATHADAAYILNDLILDYNEDHPEIIFELITDDHLIDLILNDVDIAIRPYDSHAKGIQQELLYNLVKRLYASEEYLEKYGEPKTVEDLKHHYIIAHSHPEEFPYSNVNWILKLGMPAGEMHKPIFMSTSIECLIDAAKRGKGIIASYNELTILQRSQLKNILPDITYKEQEGYLIYPNYLKDDKAIIDLKNYLCKKLNVSEI